MRLEQFQWTPAHGWDRPLQSTALAADAQLVLLFGIAGAVIQQECPTLFESVFPRAHVVGCTTGGEILGTRVGDGSLVATVIAFEHSQIAVAKAKIADVGGSQAAGEALVRQLDPNGLRHVFVVSDGMLVNGSDLVEGINSVLPAGVSLTGGFAADQDNLRTTHVWCDSPPEASMAVAIGFYGERLKLGIGVTGGWGPFGPDRVITRSRKNVLFEVDGRPVLALYKQYLGEYAAGLPAAGLLFPLELKNGRLGGRVLRTLLAVDEKEQSITFAGNVPEGATVRFMVGHIEDLIDGTIQAAEKSRLPDWSAPELSLIVSCNARRAVLKQRVEEEVEAVFDILGKVPTAGFYSYGEIGPPRLGALSELHNETMTITNISER